MLTRRSITRAFVLGLSPLLGVTAVLVAPGTAGAASTAGTASTAGARQRSAVVRIVDLGTLGGSFSRIAAVSEDGRGAVGTSIDAAGEAEGDPFHFSRMFVWHQGRMTDLGTFGYL